MEGIRRRVRTIPRDLHYNPYEFTDNTASQDSAQMGHVPSGFASFVSGVQ